MNQELAQRLVAEAMSWVGTPFEHQGQLKRVGVDCVHFVDIVAANVGIPGVEIPQNYRPQEDGSLMLRLLDEHLDLVPNEDRQAGDVIVFCDEALREPDVPRHMGFITEVTAATTFIVEAGMRGVVRHRLDGWWNNRIHSIWRLRESS